MVAEPLGCSGERRHVETVSTTEQRSIGGYMVETSDLKQLSWSDALLQNGPLDR